MQIIDSAAFLVFVRFPDSNHNTIRLLLTNIIEAFRYAYLQNFVLFFVSFQQNKHIMTTSIDDIRKNNPYEANKSSITENNAAMLTVSCSKRTFFSQFFGSSIIMSHCIHLSSLLSSFMSRIRLSNLIDSRIIIDNDDNTAY